jgi:hypothetical protein
MKINRSNYEAFFLDFHEGNLSEVEKREVIAFVEANPDVKEEFESFNFIFIEKSKDLKFPGKENLKKNSINVNNYKTWLVAFVEDDLNQDEKAEVEKFLSENQGYNRELEILRQTKIYPDYSIRFTGKSSLKKGGVVVPMWVRYAAAACVVFGLLAYFFVQRKPASEFAHQTQPENKVSAPVIQPEETHVAEIKPEVPVINNEKKEEQQKPLQRKPAEMKVREDLAKNDSVKTPSQYKMAPEKLFAQERDTLSKKDQSTIVINEGASKDSTMKKMVVLDDNDLAELGLNEKQLPNSKLADAVNSVGKLFNVNAHYDKSQQQFSKPTETWALGPLKFKRTVSR